VLLQLARGPNAELSRQAIETLAAIGAGAGREFEPLLVTKLHDGTIPLLKFAEVVGRIEIRSESTRAILERGVHDNDRWTARACANALCMTSSEPDRTARLVIGAARDRSFDNRDAIAALNELKGAGDSVMRFLVAQLESTDYWTRHDAINALGDFGETASQAVAPLKKLLEDPSPLIRLKAAKANFLISDNPVDLEKQLEIVFAKHDPDDCHNAVETIGELGRAGARFVHYVKAELSRSPPEYADAEIKALQAIATKDAVAALRAAAESLDWILRTQATEALRNIGKPKVQRGN
jgi:HEAT repeat protein